MGFEKIVAAEPAKQPAQSCACSLPDPASYGPGTVWVCSTCRTRWVMNPAKTLRYGFGAWMERVTLVPPLLMFLSGDDPVGWRRARAIDKWAIALVCLIAWVSIFAVLGSIGG